jgi:two-component system NtrC family sensor kinase
MMSARPPLNRRILIIDDNLSIHDDFRRILAPVDAGDDLDAEAAMLLGESAAGSSAPGAGAVFELSFASQGQEALKMVVANQSPGTRFALAFVDMRMPPGWDGMTTILKLWETDPELHVVICTAHSDRTWDEIATSLTARDRWAVLKKPFDKIEVLQLAHVMIGTWNLGQAAAAATVAA